MADGNNENIMHKNCGTGSHISAVGGNDFMIYTPDNYYMASRNALKGIAFRVDGKNEFHLKGFGVH